MSADPNIIDGMTMMQNAKKQMFAQLDECNTQMDLENFIVKKKNTSQWILIAGIIICIIGVIGGLAAEYEMYSSLFWMLGGILGISLLITPLIIRPVIKEAERRLSKIAFLENSIKAIDDDVFIKQLMQAVLNKDWEDHEVKIFKHYMVYTEADCSDSGHPVARLANLYGDSSVIGIRAILIAAIKKNPKLREGIQKDIARINQYYSDTIAIIGNEDVIDSIAEIFLGTATQKQKSEIKEMLLWLEQEKDHTISKMLCNRCGIEGRFEALVDICEENKDTFIKILNERNSTSNSTDNKGKGQEIHKTTASESPKPSNGKLTIGNIVFN